MSMAWCRLWVEMPNDPKWRTLSRVSKQRIGDVMAVFIHMMTVAAQSEERGIIEGWSDEDVASALDLETEDVEAIRNAMQGRVLDGMRLIGWERRQPTREDGSAERARHWREKEKQKPNATERNRTQPNAQKRPDTDTDTDTDTDKDKEKTSLVAEGAKGKEGLGAPKRKTAGADAPRPTFPPCPPWLDEPVWQSFVDHRKARRKPLTPQAAILTLNGLEKARSFGHDPAALIETAIQAGWTGCVFEDRHFQPARPATPGGGRATGDVPMLSRVGEQQRRNIDAWLRRDSVIEGAIHERH